MSETVLKEIVRSGVHIGHRKSRRHPKMMPYIFGIRGNTEVIDIEKTHEALEAACAFVRERAAKGETFLFVGTRPSVSPFIRGIAGELLSPYVVSRWIGGTMTNFSVISKRLETFRKLAEAERSGELAEKYTKAERVRFQRQLARFEEQVGGIRDMLRLPDVLLLTSLRADILAAREAKKRNIPVIAIVDTDTDPTLATYPIPGNDDAILSIQYIFGKLAEAIKHGRAQAKQITESKPHVANDEKPEKA